MEYNFKKVKLMIKILILLNIILQYYEIFASLFAKLYLKPDKVPKPLELISLSHR